VDAGADGQTKALPTCVTSVCSPDTPLRLPLMVLPAVVVSSFWHQGRSGCRRFATLAEKGARKTVHGPKSRIPRVLE
jgi:hypothetical protein